MDQAPALPHMPEKPLDKEKFDGGKKPAAGGK
jgi:hypothetical protein